MSIKKSTGVLIDGDVIVGGADASIFIYLALLV